MAGQRHWKMLFDVLIREAKDKILWNDVAGAEWNEPAFTKMMPILTRNGEL